MCSWKNSFWLSPEDGFGWCQGTHGEPGWAPLPSLEVTLEETGWASCVGSYLRRVITRNLQWIQLLKEAEGEDDS